MLASRFGLRTSRWPWETWPWIATWAMVVKWPSFAGWWWLEHDGIIFPYIGNNHPNWLERKKNKGFVFPINIGNVIIPADYMICFRGVGKNQQPDCPGIKALGFTSGVFHVEYFGCSGGRAAGPCVKASAKATKGEFLESVLLLLFEFWGIVRWLIWTMLKHA